VADFLQSKKPVQLLLEWGIPSVDMVALVPQHKGMSARIKTFIEFVVQRIERTLPWRSGKKN
jgi:DNA-binding transcriptional LysR family regulator